ncbi:MULTISPECIES: chemotaxis protein CheW [unclassified Vibrio]|uniref:chemotaxis protein CheW n=1 Tax=unclassified Vibrio TaxID=2614977 RepID=UPI001372ACB1|nr:MULTISPECIES: chemotaxis protein CheW [unclassified Vibrio]NAW88947.1 hypothetical protein [Vibrio sp. V24_P1S3T111]
MTSVEIEHHNESKTVSSWLLLYLSGYKNPFAINIEHVQEILPYSSISAIPETPPYVLGGVTLRMRTMPVLDLSALLGALTAQEGAVGKTFVIIECLGEHLVLLVEKVDHIIDCSQDKFHLPPKEAGNNIFIQGVIESEGGLIQALDVNKVIRLSCRVKPKANHQQGF